jgi:hypothetical protein
VRWVVLHRVPAERVSVYEGRAPSVRWEPLPHLPTFPTAIGAMRAFVDPLYESAHLSDEWVRRTWRGPCRVLHGVKLERLHMNTCITCDQPREGACFCERCGRAWNRAERTNDSTHAAAFEWIAERARRFERKKARERLERFKRKPTSKEVP